MEQQSQLISRMQDQITNQIVETQTLLLEGQTDLHSIISNQTQILFDMMENKLSIPRIPLIVTSKLMNELKKSEDCWKAVTKLLKSPFLKHDRLFFICPISLQVAETNGGLGYEISQPRKWVKEHLGLVKFGLLFLKLRLRTFVGSAFDEAVNSLDPDSNSSFFDLGLDEESLRSVEKFVDRSTRSAYNEEMEQIRRRQENMESNGEEAKSFEMTKEVIRSLIETSERSYREVEKLVKDQDVDVVKSGLVKKRSDFDGSTAWIMDEESVIDKFNSEGKS